MLIEIKERLEHFKEASKDELKLKPEVLAHMLAYDFPALIDIADVSRGTLRKLAGSNDQKMAKLAKNALKQIDQLLEKNRKC